MLRYDRQRQMLSLLDHYCYNPAEQDSDAKWTFLESFDQDDEAAAGARVRVAAASPVTPLVQDIVGGEASPAGITGDNVTIGTSQEITTCLDWQNVTGPLENLERVLDLVSNSLGPAEKREHGMRNFPDGAYQWESGAILAWRNSYGGRAMLSMNGDSLSHVPQFRLKRMIVKLDELGFTGARLDAALDVPTSMLTMDQVHAAAAAGHYRGFRRHYPHRPQYRTGQVIGSQVNFGLRENGVLERWYDKGLESKGEIPKTRGELEVHGDKAKLLWSHLVAACREDAPPDAFEKLLGQVVVGHIDFTDRSGAHRHADRFSRLDWWQKIVDKIGAVKLRIHKAEVPLERFLLWLPGCVAGKLAAAEMFLDSIGQDSKQFFDRLMQMILLKGRNAIDSGAVPCRAHLGFDPGRVLEGFGDEEDRAQALHDGRVIAAV